MSRQRTEHSKTFRATSDDGRTFTIDEYRQYCRASVSSNDSWTLRSVYFETTDGMRVDHIGNGRYQIQALGINLTPDSEPSE